MKKILSLLLVFVMAFATVGCGGSGGSSLSTGGGESGSASIGSTSGGAASGSASGEAASSDETYVEGGYENKNETIGGSTSGGNQNTTPGSVIVDKNADGTLNFGTNGLTDGYYKITEAKESDTPAITIDFSDKLGSQVQNTKKIDVFSPTWNFIYSYGLNYEAVDTLEYLQDFKAESLRFDMMFGGSGGIGDSGKGESKYVNGGDILNSKSWVLVDGLSDALAANDVLPYYVMVGVPEYVQNGSSINYPQDTYFTDFCVKAAQYFKNSDRRVIYETWNEPDLNNTSYFSGTATEFAQLNCKAAAYYKKGNADAYVVEGGLCWPKTTYPASWSTWISETKAYQNHIDALSWHFYGDKDGNLNYGSDSGSTDKGDLLNYCNFIWNYLNDDSYGYDFHTTTMHISEFSPAKTFGNNYPNEVQVSYISKIYDAIRQIKEVPDVTRVSYGCWLFDKQEFTMIDPYSYIKYPVYNVLWSNGRLPLAPVAVTNNVSSDFYVNTGIDSHRAAAVIMNNDYNSSNPNGDARVDAYTSSNTNTKKDVTVLLKNIPDDAKNIKIYLIDAEHTSYSTNDDKPYLIMDLPSTQVKTPNMKFNFTIPENAAFHIEISDGTTDENGELICETDIRSALYDHVVRKDYYYEDHRQNMPYGDIYEAAQKVSLTMMNNNSGKAAVMVTYDDMNEFTTLKLDWDLWDLGTAQSNKGIGVRIDYQTSSGYVSPKYYYYGDYNNCFYYNYTQADANGYTWGTGAPSVSGVSFGSALNGSYTIPLAANAPSGWNGRIQITYYMMDAGANANAVFTMNAN